MIYLDNNATTKIDPLVQETMSLLMTKVIGNPSSLHRHGQMAKAELAAAKKRVASFFGVQTDELVFTSGATEALNMVIRSAERGSHIITSSLEHIAVLESLKMSGCSVTYIDPEPGKGAATVTQVEKALRTNTTMIVIMAANNETGIKTDIEAIADLAYQRRIHLVVDGVAILGKEQLTLSKGVSAICFSGHKIHAPTGIGLAIVRKRFRLCPLILGGPQQQKMRGGTEHLVGIAAFAKAIELFELPSANVHMATLRNRFEEGIAKLSDVIIHGASRDRVCNTSNIGFLGVNGESLLINLDLQGVAVSHGSACSLGTLEPSRVLLNMGISSEIVQSSVRFSVSRFTTQKEIDRAVDIVSIVVHHLREL